MNDNSSKRAASTEVKNEGEEQKKFRGTFFGADLENVVAELKRELFTQTNEFFQVSFKDHSEFLRMLKELKTDYKNHKEKQESVFKMDEEEESLKKSGLFSKTLENNLSVYLEKIPFFIKFSDILKSVKPHCDFIEVNILRPFRRTIESIREACGCDLKDPTTWKIARPYTDKLCELANKFEDRKVELCEKRDNFLTQMQLFILTYQYAEEEERKDFLAQLNETPEGRAWIQPWVDVAEKKDNSLEGALMTAQNTLSANQNVVVKQGIVGL